MSKICIEFDCPMANKLTKNDSGNYDCLKCQKKVYDFTHMNQKEFSEKVPEIQNNELCGLYRLDQVSKTSKLNWKTRINLKYNQWSHASRLFLIPALLLGFVLFITSCRTRRVAGKMMASNWEYNNDQKHIDNTAHLKDSTDDKKNHVSE